MASGSSICREYLLLAELEMPAPLPESEGLGEEPDNGVAC